MPFELRPHQEKAINMLRASLRSGKRRPVLQASTGFGKSLVGYHMISSAMRKGNRSTFIVPALSLIDQTAERFITYGMDPANLGIMQGDHPWYRPHAPLQICTVQTLARRGMPISDLIVVDECHTRSVWLNNWILSEEGQKVPVIGLSATPWSKGLGKIFDDLVSPISMQELIEQGFLSKFRVFAPSHPDLSKVSTVAGDYHEGQLADAMSQGALVADIVSTWLGKAQGLPTLCFCVNRAHAQLIHESFEKSGVNSAYVDANSTREEREDILVQLRAGRITIICSIGTMTTGVDEDIRCIIFARPTKSRMLYVQAIGRGLRTAEGKEECLILDHSDTTLRLGLVTDIHYDELHDGSEKAKLKREADDAKIKLPRTCISCGGLIPAGIKNCIHCGYENKPKSEVEVIEGELVEFTGKPDKSKGPKKEKKKEYTMAEKQAFYSGLRYLASDRGKNDSWVLANYREKFGTWPKGLNNVSCFPSAEVRSWDNHKRIAWAKRKQNTGAQHAG